MPSPLLNVRRDKPLIQLATNSLVLGAATAPYLLDDLRISVPLLLVQLAEYAVHLLWLIRLVTIKTVGNGSHRGRDLDDARRRVLQIPENLFAVLECPVVFALAGKNNKAHAATSFICAYLSNQKTIGSGLSITWPNRMAWRYVG